MGPDLLPGFHTLDPDFFFAPSLAPICCHLILSKSTSCYDIRHPSAPGLCRNKVSLCSCMLFSRQFDPVQKKQGGACQSRSFRHPHVCVLTASRTRFPLADIDASPTSSLRASWVLLAGFACRCLSMASGVASHACSSDPRPLQSR